VEKATFAAGCFWQVEADFRKLSGVTRTAAGYTGGSLSNPSYQEVCTDTTGHAEAVLVEFDPTKVSYEELLDVFWKSHNPTQLNRQGPDVGSQYRTGIFFYSEDQEKAAIASRDAAQAHFKRPIVTEIKPAGDFYEAEEYHQRYLEKKGLASCTVELASKA
jgi:peptide-methionine (S)-S-oxide reductase